MTRIGIMSAAHLHATAYAGALRVMTGVELVGVADDASARGDEFAARFGVPRFDRYETLLAQEVDGVIVCSENARHRPLVEMAAGAGVHVLCEKPLATSVADAQAMLEACRRTSVALMVAFPMRFSAPLREAKRILDEERLGRIHCVTGVNQGRNPRRHGAWFVDRTLAGGGALTDHTVHLVDALRWLLGSEVTEVYAQANEIMPSGGDVETGGLVLLAFAGGVFASLDCSWSRPDSYPTWGGFALEIVGERGVLAADAFRQNVVVYPGGAARPHWAYWGSDPDRAMLEEFIGAIRERRPPAVTGRDGYEATRVVAAAYESIRTGVPVKVPGPEG